MLRVLLAASLLLPMAACQHVGNEPHRDRRAELAQEHPLNGTWHQAAKSDEENATIVIFENVALDHYWQVRGGKFDGALENGHAATTDFSWDAFNVYHHPEQQHGYAGTVEITYNTDIYYDDDDRMGRMHTEYCTFAVSSDETQAIFSEGCGLIRGTFNKVM